MIPKGKILFRKFYYLILISTLISCSPITGKASVDTPSVSTLAVTGQAVTPMPPTATPAPTATPTIWISPDLPEGFRKTINLPGSWVESPQAENASFRIEIIQESGASKWVYALVAPFPTIQDQVTFSQLQLAWQGQSPKELQASKLMVQNSDLKALETVLGPSSSQFVQAVQSKSLVDDAWSQKAWAIIPFEQIEPRWKVIAIDGNSPLEKTFHVESYPLSLSIGITHGQTSDPSTSSENFLPSNGQAIFAATNRDPQKLTTVVLTGVTALVRGTAAMMEVKGVTYPGQDIRDILREADIAHINNEVPFSPTCTQPPVTGDALVFCSKPAYYGLLKDIGTDVVELAGDHFADWGMDAVYYTLNLYQQQGLKIYGGGKNLTEGKKPLLIEHNGNRLAFIGCNAKPPGYATASDNRPGAVHCDFDYLKSEIKRLKKDGYLPIVTFQHLEYYSTTAHPLLQADFHAVADAGAVVVSGSQAHIPQAMEFRSGAFLHYGLGNLFFDQYYESEATRKSFIDRHIFYDGRYIGAELLTIEFVDIARPIVMPLENRDIVLADVFKASGW